MAFKTHSAHEDTIARLADIAYQAVLKRGLPQPFVDVELEIWNDIRSTFRQAADAAGAELVPLA